MPRVTTSGLAWLPVCCLFQVKVDLRDNPVWQVPKYRDQIILAASDTLSELDGEPIPNAHRQYCLALAIQRMRVTPNSDAGRLQAGKAEAGVGGTRYREKGASGQHQGQVIGTQQQQLQAHQPTSLCAHGSMAAIPTAKSCFAHLPTTRPSGAGGFKPGGVGVGGAGQVPGKVLGQWPGHGSQAAAGAGRSRV